MRSAVALGAISMGFAVFLGTSSAEHAGDPSVRALDLPVSLVSEDALDELSREIAELPPFPASEESLASSPPQAPALVDEGALAQR